MANPKVTGGLVAIAIIGAGCYFLTPHCDRETYTAKVTEKERIVDGDDSKYLIYTELQDGKVRVFENTDSLIERKWNSSDLYARIKQEKTYDFDTYGWRIPFMSLYENIIDLREVPDSEPENSSEKTEPTID
jgi:hypothetical protein